MDFQSAAVCDRGTASQIPSSCSEAKCKSQCLEGVACCVWCVCLPGQGWLIKQLVCPQVLLSNCTSLVFEDTIPADMLVGTESCLKFSSCVGWEGNAKEEEKEASTSFVFF